MAMHAEKRDLTRKVVKSSKPHARKSLATRVALSRSIRSNSQAQEDSAEQIVVVVLAVVGYGNCQGLAFLDSQAKQAAQALVCCPRCIYSASLASIYKRSRGRQCRRQGRWGIAIQLACPTSVSQLTAAGAKGPWRVIDHAQPSLYICVYGVSCPSAS